MSSLFIVLFFRFKSKKNFCVEKIFWYNINGIKQFWDLYIIWIGVLGSRQEDRTKYQCDRYENIEMDEWRTRKEKIRNVYTKVSIGVASIIVKIKEDRLR